MKKLLTVMKNLSKLHLRLWGLKELKNNFPIIILIAAFLLVFTTNFSPNTFLIGWDNRLQELNPILNLKRYIFSVWQEYQGLGLLAGHAHASELPHAIFITFLSIFLPMNIVRQAFTFLMLFIGPLGMYFLIKGIVRFENSLFNKIVPLFGALFYLFNLSTLQTFYTPLEPFIVNYAFLPWLIFSSIYLIANKTRKAMIFFLLVNIAAIPQAQIPTVFFVYLFALSFFLFVLILETKKREVLISSIKVILITLLINSLWLLPFLFFFFTNSKVALEAKINQMSTQTIFLQNREFGDIFDVMLLKGFWFNNVDLNLKGNFGYMLADWQSYLNLPVELIGFLFFGIILLGFVYVKRRAPFALPFSLLFILAFTMLAVNTPPFSWLDYLFRQIPIFNEMFRFPFTKFSILSALTYSFFFAIGIGKLFSLSEKYYKPNRQIIYSISGILIVLIFIFNFPIFKGKLFYEKEKIKIPAEYFQVFDFFKKQNSNARIANFPQYTYWGWNFYKWGYVGSGFLWYGIKQPILDRAFDVWSRNDENYYWELSYALYSKKPTLFRNILEKYQINYLLIDKNVINPTSPKALFFPETEMLIEQIPSIQKEVSYGNIDIYKVNLSQNVNNFVYLTKKGESVNNFNWGNFDQEYQKNPNYISDKNWDIFYPFRSIFSGKNQENKEFDLVSNGDYMEFSNNLPVTGNSKLNIPQNYQNNLVSVNFSLRRNTNGSYLILAKIETPQVFIDSERVWGQSIEKPIFLIPQNNLGHFDLNFGSLNSDFYLNSNQNLGSIYISSDNDSTVSLTTNFGIFQTNLSGDVSSALNEPSDIELKKNRNSKITVRIPKIDDKILSFTLTPSSSLNSSIRNCEKFRKGIYSSSVSEGKLDFDSNNATPCISLYMPLLPHDQGYAIFAQNQNIEGRPLHFWILNEDQKSTILDTYFKPNKTLSSDTFVIPPYEEFGQGYSLNFENSSIGEETKNKLGPTFVYPVPYNFLNSITIENAPIPGEQLSQTGNILSVKHPNESLYEVNANLKTGDNLILSQSYDIGWKVYEVKDKGILTSIFPFLFSNELKNHVLVNNWENGWSLDNKMIDDRSSIIIVYLPQYLEYLGFLIFVLSLVYLLKKRF